MLLETYTRSVSSKDQILIESPLSNASEYYTGHAGS